LSAAVPLPASATLLPLAVGLAVADALTPWSTEIGLKWVNDVVARGRKLGGVLVEASRGVAVVGIGLNVRTPAVEGAIGLSELTDAPPAPDSLAPVVLASLERTLAWWGEAGNDALRAAWRRRAVTLGQRVCVDDLEGEAHDVGPAGELVLRLPDGSLRAIVSGTVRHADGSYCGPTR
jgi:BirA family biotin operon repressor/biotin-[acetyl-CoA-carboxylase] ligase